MTVMMVAVVMAILVTVMPRMVMRRGVVGAMTRQCRSGAGERHGARHREEANRPPDSPDHVFSLLWFAFAGNVTRERSELQLDMSPRTSRAGSGRESRSAGDSAITLFHADGHPSEHPPVRDTREGAGVARHRAPVERPAQPADTPSLVAPPSGMGTAPATSSTHDGQRTHSYMR